MTYDEATSTFTVSPTGSDDTPNIQTAFDGCSARGPKCTVQLGEGTFYTAQIVVRDFHGEFRGLGESTTTVEALPELPVSTDFPVSVLHPPSPENPWPSLFTFIDGAYSISGITFVEPHATPTQGYWVNARLRADALFAFISITGLSATAAVDHVTMIGASGDWPAPDFFNTVNGIFPQALMMTPGSTDFSGVIPFRVTFRVTNSAFYTIDNPLAFENLVDSQVTITGNTFDTTEYPVALVDMSHSMTTVSRNVARNVFIMADVLAVQGIPISTLMPCEEPSKLFITDNDFEFTYTANAFAGQDFGEFNGCGRSLDVFIADNVMRADATSWPAVVGMWMRSVVAMDNEILGGSGGVWLFEGTGMILRNEILDNIGTGILLDTTWDVLVEGNHIANTGEVGIALVDGSNHNLIIRNLVENSGILDLYWDQTGAGNLWVKNECETSDPPGLCP